MKIGDIFTRSEISKLLGGSEVPYAPTKNGKVTCLCLDPERNPKAPEAILPGTGEGIERTRDQVISQKGPFPTFLKKKTNEWKYIGKYTVTGYSIDPRMIDDYYEGCKTPRNEVTAVIWTKNSV